MNTHTVSIPAAVLAALFDAAADMHGRATYLAPESFDGPEHEAEFNDALATAQEAIEAAKHFHGLAVSPPKGYAAYVPGKGYLAEQGREQWFEENPVGWALFAERRGAEGLANRTPGAEVAEVR